LLVEQLVAKVKGTEREPNTEKQRSQVQVDLDLQNSQRLDFKNLQAASNLLSKAEALLLSQMAG
jgi:hypothetical protein